MNAVLLDWFSVTFHTTLEFHFDYALSLIRSITGDTTIEWLPYSRLRGYNRCGTVLDGLGLVGISEDNKRSLEMGVHLSLSASALGVLASRFGVIDDETGEVHFDFISFITSIINAPPPEYYEEMTSKPYTSVSRCDFALDDNDALLNLSYIEALCDEKFSGRMPYVFSTRFRSPAESRKALGGAGNTIYFGSALSASRIRFYNKSAEKKLEGFHWVRCELQLRNDRADSFCRTIKTVEDVSSLVLNYLDFKEVFSDDVTDTNITRFDTASWWVEFLGTTDKLRLGAGTEVRKVEDLDRWVDRQASSAIAVLAECYGEARLASLVSDGKEKFRKKHYDMIAQFKEVNGDRQTDLIIDTLRLGGSLVTSDETRKFMQDLNAEKRSKAFVSFISSISGSLYASQLRQQLARERSLNWTRKKVTPLNLVKEVRMVLGSDLAAMAFSGY